MVRWECAAQMNQHKERGSVEGEERGVGRALAAHRAPCDGEDTPTPHRLASKRVTQEQTTEEIGGEVDK